MNIKQLPGALPPAVRTDRAAGVDAAASAAAGSTVAAGQAVNVNVTSLAAAAPAERADAVVSNQELLLALKARIQAGDFAIDYGALARSLVEDAVVARSGLR
jgi:anti-sigma28 factor (negative regulator of flagellin synthesis)